MLVSDSVSRSVTVRDAQAGGEVTQARDQVAQTGDDVSHARDQVL